jgi:hypothetical protein
LFFVLQYKKCYIWSVATHRHDPSCPENFNEIEIALPLLLGRTSLFSYFILNPSIFNCSNRSGGLRKREGLAYYVNDSAKRRMVQLYLPVPYLWSVELLSLPFALPQIASFSSGNGHGCCCRRRRHCGLYAAPAAVCIPASPGGYTLHPEHTDSLLEFVSTRRRCLIIPVYTQQSVPRRWCWGIPPRSAGGSAFHAERRRWSVLCPYLSLPCSQICLLVRTWWGALD